MEQLNYNLLYRWFVGLGVDEPVAAGPPVCFHGRFRRITRPGAHPKKSTRMTDPGCANQAGGSAY
jgi:hypothetical protein